VATDERTNDDKQNAPAAENAERTPDLTIPKLDAEAEEKVKGGMINRRLLI
jgi:hypothetical protein